jgi:hypothetical protein
MRLHELPRLQVALFRPAATSPGTCQRASPCQLTAELTVITTQQRPGNEKEYGPVGVSCVVITVTVVLFPVVGEFVIVVFGICQLTVHVPIPVQLAVGKHPSIGRLVISKVCPALTEHFSGIELVNEHGGGGGTQAVGGFNVPLYTGCEFTRMPVHVGNDNEALVEVVGPSVIAPAVVGNHIPVGPCWFTSCCAEPDQVHPSVPNGIQIFPVPPG